MIRLPPIHDTPVGSLLRLMVEYEDMGCKDLIKRGLAGQVYIYLVEMFRLKKVKAFYDDELKEIYFVGTEIKNDVEKTNVYLPLSNYDGIDLEHLEKIQSKLCKDSEQSLVVCICDGSTTVIAYSLTKGLKFPSALKDGKLTDFTED